MTHLGEYIKLLKVFGHSGYFSQRFFIAQYREIHNEWIIFQDMTYHGKIRNNDVIEHESYRSLSVST